MKTFLLITIGVFGCFLGTTEGVFRLRVDSNGAPVNAEINVRNEVLADTLVDIKNGSIKGIVGKALNSNKNIYIYYRIPYAAPPVGDLRFAPPTESQGWEGTLNATVLPLSCAQWSPAIMPASEDCLYLNVYTTMPPEETTKEPLPVMVWFHGGGFTMGESSYYAGGKMLSFHDFVLVVVHYRLGPFGFLSTGDEVSPGNYGLKDQSQALRWVQENIGAFGGNPDQVTIFGESAGGSSTLGHLISPLSKGLFHRVIAQSGTPIAEWSIDRKPAESAKQFAEFVGCRSDGSQNLVNCLRSLPWEYLAEQQYIMMNQGYKKLEFGLETAAPVVEPNHPGAFYTKEPIVLLKEGNYPDLPVILGTVMHEGSYILGELYLAKIGPENLTDNAEWLRDEIIPALLNTFGSPEGFGSGSVSQSIALTYLAGSKRTNWDEMMSGLVDIMSVFFMKGPVLKTADLLSKHLSNVYLYSYEHYSINSMWFYLYLGITPPPITPGITHSDDLLPLFTLPMIPNPADRAFSDIFIELWTNFANTGNPTPVQSDKYPSWPKYSINEGLYMKLNQTPTVHSDFTSTWRPRGFEPQ